MTTNPFWQVVFTPGLKIKRWVIIGVLGIMTLGYGFASIMRRLLFRPNIPGGDIIEAATLQWIPVQYRDIGLIVFGLALTVLSFMTLLRVLTAPFGVPRSSREWANALMLYQRLHSGPVITVMGGGDQLISILRSIKSITSNLTVIIMPESPDDWQDEDSILQATPPYIFSLANSDTLTEQVLLQPIRENSQARIGDVLLSTAVNTANDIEGGLQDIGKILALSGQVIPAVIPDQTGQRPSHEAVCALMDTDYLILAPYSLEALTELFDRHPALMNAIRLSRSIRITLPPPESPHAPLLTYLEGLSHHLGKNEIQFVLVNTGENGLKKPAADSGMRLIPVSGNPDRADSDGVIEALTGIHHIYGLKRHRRWRI